MLKILQLIPTLDRSGAEKQMVLLAKGLPRDRFTCRGRHADPDSARSKAELKAAGIPVTAIGKRLKFDPPALSRLVRLLRTGRFDVRPDLDLRGQHLRPGRRSNREGPGRDHDRDGR